MFLGCDEKETKLPIISFCCMLSQLFLTPCSSFPVTAGGPMKKSTVKLERVGPWRASSGIHEPSTCHRVEKKMMFYWTHPDAMFCHKWAPTSPSPSRRLLYWCRGGRHLCGLMSCCHVAVSERLTSVLATFPLCVMFLLCFSLAMRILCFATIFRGQS